MCRAGCNTDKIRAFIYGLHASAFERAWGLPTKTYVCPGGEVQTRNFMTVDVSKRTAPVSAENILILKYY